MRTNFLLVSLIAFIGLYTSLFTFNQLLDNKFLPEETPIIQTEQGVKGAHTEAQSLTMTHTNLPMVIEQSLLGATGKYSIAIKNITTGEAYFKDENMPYEAASLYKLWVMGTVYQKIESGKLTKAKLLTASIPTLNASFAIGSASAERTQGTISATVSTALANMITVSDNYSALLLSSEVGMNTVAQFLQEHQLLYSHIGSPPTTTAADTLLFFEKLANGELANTKDTNEMLTLLKQQKLNSKLPKYLPDGLVIAHKTGELDSVSHDAGIVYTDHGTYIIVVLSDTTVPKDATERIATISKNVYDYFMSE